MLEELRFSDASRDREFRYYMAIGYYKLGNYKEAKKYLLPLLQQEPSNDQFLSLKTELDNCINRGIQMSYFYNAL